MPWRETSPMEQRLDFVREYESGLFTMTELAAQYGISRKTGYKWLARVRGARARGLQDRSRRPHHSPHATDPALVEAIARAPPPASALGRRRSCWRWRRAATPTRAWPARSTIARSAEAARLGAARRRRRAAARPTRRPLAPITRPNEVWTTDFKGEFLTGDRRVLLSVDAARWLQSVCAAVRCVDRRTHRGDAPPLRARLCRVRLARSDSQ